MKKKMEEQNQEQMRLFEEKIKKEMEEKESARLDAFNQMDLMKNEQSRQVEQQLETKIG